MASMISHFGTIVRKKINEKPSSEYCWDGTLDLGSNLSNVKCPVAQMKFLLEQSLAAAMYIKFYGLRCNECITEYINELNTDICYRFTRTCGKEFKDNFQTIFTILNNLVKFNRGGNWTDVNISLVSEFLFDGTNRENVPVVWDVKHRGALIPFLMWMNKGVQPDYLTFANEFCGVTCFELEEIGFNTDSGKMEIVPFHNFIGRSFSAEKVPLDKLEACPILGFLSHFNWAETTFERCVGIISGYCPHLDIERYGITMTHHLAYCMRQGVIFPAFNVSGCNEGVAPVVSRYRDQLFNAVLAFVKFCTSSRGMTVVDREVIAKTFGCIAFTKEQQDSVAYLRKTDAVPSADEYKAFKQTMGAVESLQLISQNPTLASAQSNQVTGSTEEAGAGTSENENKSGSESDANKNEGAKPATSEPEKKEGTSNDNDEPTDDDDGADDAGMDDTPIDPDDDETNPDGDDTGAGNDSGESGATTSNVQNGGTPEDVHLSDEKGIEFKIALPDSETVDSVLFREEMDKFLTNVLTNPPKCMSPQDIQTLTALKRFWLHCLSIETVTGIVEACIKLPLTIKHSIHKSTELKQ